MRHHKIKENSTNGNQEDSQNKLPPKAGSELTKPKENEIPTGDLERKAENKPQNPYPNWIMAGASIALVILTFFYTWYAREQVYETQEALRITKDTMRLDQRAWLGYRGYTIQARKNDNSQWTNREPGVGEQFRVKFGVYNTGKTPAFHVRLEVGKPDIVPVGEIPRDTGEWSIGPGKYDIYPNDASLSQSSNAMSLSNQAFPRYSGGTEELFLRVRLHYCDTFGKRHWIKADISHAYGSKEFTIRSSSASRGHGEANHQDCQSPL